MKTINSKEFKKLFLKNRDNLEIIDVRENDEYELIRIKGSKLIPLNEIPARINEIDWDKKVIIVCRSGSRSGYITEMLTKAGKDATNLEGGGMLFTRRRL